MLACRTHLVGQRPKFRVTFDDEETAELVDPTTVIAMVREPSGLERTHVLGVSSELVRLSEGVFQLPVLLTDPGEWVVRFQAKGNHFDAKEKRVTVRGSAFSDPIPSDESPEDAFTLEDGSVITDEDDDVITVD